MTSGANGTATSLSQEVLRYAAGVRAELADLTPAQRDDLLEDLEDHLSEVAAELDEPLQSRLGPPEVYAAELRASAGIAPAMPQPRDATSRMRQFWDSSVVRSVRGFLVELQPAWWVLRGLLLAIVLAAIFGPFAGFVFGIAAVVVSVLLGRRTRGRRGPWALSILVNVIAVIALLASGFAASGGGSYAVVEEPYGSIGPAPGSLAHEDGTPITNIFPYDAQGQPLSGVRLYDQNGRPITNMSNYGEDGEVIDRTYPVEPNGLRVRNAYPQELTIVDEFGGPPTRIPAPVPPVPPLTPTPTPTSTPTPSASVSPAPPG
jgi:uncharacterized membrane protein